MTKGPISISVPPSQVAGRWKVDYALIDAGVLGPKRWCVYTGTDRDQFPCSSINAVEYIIAAIVARERLHPAFTDFFDLQTTWWYTNNTKGIFAFDKIVGRYTPTGMDHVSWESYECPQSIFELFQQQIGDFDFEEALRLQFPRTSQREILGLVHDEERHVRLRDEKIGAALTSDEYHILTVEQARAQGYVFQPGQHSHYPLEKKDIAENEVVVHLDGHPHLMAQCVCCASQGKANIGLGINGPRPFSTWTKSK